MSQTWLSRLMSPKSRGARRARPSCRPQLERLEDRVTPSIQTYTWTGFAGNGKWSDANNWAPSGLGYAPWLNGPVKLEFFGYSPQMPCHDDITNLAVDSINFDAPSAWIDADPGASITLTNGITTNWVTAGATDRMNVPIVLANNPSGHAMTIDPSQPLSLGPVISSGAALSGAGGLTVTGGGVLMLDGSNTYTGPTQIVGATLQAAGYKAIPSNSAVYVTGGTFDLHGYPQTIASLSGDGKVTLGVGTLTVGDAKSNTTFSGVISGAGSLHKVGQSTLVLSGKNTYAWTTAADAGFLRLGADNALSSATNVTVAAGATFDVGTHAVTVGPVTGAGTVTIGTGGALHTNVGLTAATFSGAITGAGALCKEGGATLTLSGNNTYTGGTKVSAGWLLVTGSLAPSGKVSVAGGVTLGGTGTVGDVDVYGVLLPGVNGSGTLTTGNVWFASGATYALPANGRLVANGKADLSNHPTLNALGFTYLSPLHAPFSILQATQTVGWFQWYDPDLAALVPLTDGGHLTVNGPAGPNPPMVGMNSAHGYVIHYTAAGVTLTRIS
jgi:autotransporter-associated beta strand protein